MAILDIWGNPIERAQLQEPQTARLSQLHTEYENHPSRGLTPSKLAKILQDAEQGDLVAQHELFQDMEEKDGHLFSVVQTRRLALQQLDFEVKPPRNASKQEQMAADYAADMLQSVGDVADVLFDMTDGIGHGFAALELGWARQGRELLPVKATHRPQAWFKTASSGLDRNQLRLRDNSADGAALWPFGWVLHQHRARSGYIARAGLFRVLAWPFLFKNYAVRDLAEFLEIYGLPLRVGTFGPSATKEDKAALLRAVVGIGHDAAAIIPEGMLIEFKEAAKGDNKTFDAMINLMEQTMSKAVLGGTLTSGEGQHGTQALGNVHNELRQDLRDADARQLQNTLTQQLIYPILAVNKGLEDVSRCPRLVFDVLEAEDLALYADAVPKLVGVGMRIPAGWAHDKLKIPQPVDDEPVLAVASTPATPTGDGEPGATAASQARHQLPAAGVAALRAGSGEPAELDDLDALANEMLGSWQETAGEVVQPILAALDNAASLEEFRIVLEEHLATLNPDSLAQMLAKGQFAARVWGRMNQRTLDDRRRDGGEA